MRRSTHSPDELRAFIAHEVEEIRNELEQLRSRVEAQQASPSPARPNGPAYDKGPANDVSTR
jgi:hypothetical protein